MAIIKSLGVGQGSNSAGNLTYRTVRGRTIASQRITANSSRTTKQVAQRSTFKNASHILSVMAFAIKMGFEKSQYGSARNNFYRMNAKALQSESLADVVNGTPYEILQILTADDQFNYITYGSGNALVTATGAEGKQASSLLFQVFNVNQDEVSQKALVFSPDGSVSVMKEPMTSDYNSAVGMVTLDSLTASFTPGSIAIIIVETPLGIVQCPYVISTPTE